MGTMRWARRTWQETGTTLRTLAIVLWSVGALLLVFGWWGDIVGFWEEPSPCRSTRDPRVGSLHWPDSTERRSQGSSHVSLSAHASQYLTVENQTRSRLSRRGSGAGTQGENGSSVATWQVICLSLTLWYSPDHVDTPRGSAPIRMRPHAPGTGHGSGLLPGEFGRRRVRARRGAGEPVRGRPVGRHSQG